MRRDFRSQAGASVELSVTSRPNRPIWSVSVIAGCANSPVATSSSSLQIFRMSIFELRVASRDTTDLQRSRLGASVGNAGRRSPFSTTARRAPRSWSALSTTRRTGHRHGSTAGSKAKCRGSRSAMIFLKRRPRRAGSWPKPENERRALGRQSRTEAIDLNPRVVASPALESFYGSSGGHTLAGELVFR